VNHSWLAATWEHLTTLHNLAAHGESAESATLHRLWYDLSATLMKPAIGLWHACVPADGQLSPHKRLRDCREPVSLASSSSTRWQPRRIIRPPSNQSCPRRGSNICLRVTCQGSQCRCVHCTGLTAGTHLSPRIALSNHPRACGCGAVQVCPWSSGASMVSLGSGQESDGDSLYACRPSCRTAARTRCPSQ